MTSINVKKIITSIDKVDTRASCKHVHRPEGRSPMSLRASRHKHNITYIYIQVERVAAVGTFRCPLSSLGCKLVQLRFIINISELSLVGPLDMLKILEK